MATSNVGICNLALAKVGATNTIASMTEASPEAAACNRVYDSVLDAVLRERDWNFSKTQKDLSLTGTAIGNWTYAYAYPSGCLKVRRIVPDSDADNPVPFEIAYNPDTAGRIILTDREGAAAEYTYRVTNVNAYDPLFVMALSWALALEIAMPITRNPKVQDSVMKGYLAYLNIANAGNAGERHKPSTRVNSISASRT